MRLHWVVVLVGQSKKYMKGALIGLDKLEMTQKDLAPFVLRFLLEYFCELLPLFACRLLYENM